LKGAGGHFNWGEVAGEKSEKKGELLAEDKSREKRMISIPAMPVEIKGKKEEEKAQSAAEKKPEEFPRSREKKKGDKFGDKSPLL